MSSVYDRDPSEGSLKTKSDTLSDDELRAITGIDEAEEQAMGRSSAEILAMERNAAAGKPTGATSSDSDGNINGPGNNTRQSLSDDEEHSPGFFKSEIAGKAVAVGKSGIKGYIKDKLGLSKRAKLSIGISAILGGGGVAIIILAMVAGGAQFIHAGRSLEQFHFTVTEAQTGVIALKLARNMHQVVNKGQREKTRMGVLGNIWANSIQDSMRASGYTFDYQSGAFKGYIVDPAKLTRAQYPGLSNTQPETIQQYFKQRYNIDATISDNGKMYINTTGSVYQEGRLLRIAMKGSGIGPTTTFLNSHIIKTKQGYTYNPMKQWITDKDNKIIASTERAAREKEFAKRFKAYARNGVQSLRFGITTSTDADGKPINGGVSDELQKVINEGDAAQAKADAGDTSALNEFRNGIAGKLSVGGLAAIGVLCLGQALAAQWDVIQDNNIIKKTERMAAHTMSLGSAVEYGDSKNIDAEYLSFVADLNYDEKNGTSLRNSCAYQMEATGGQEPGCVETPEEAKIDPNGGWLTRVLLHIPLLKQACSTTGQIILIGVSVPLIGPWGTLFGTATGLAAGPFLMQFSGWLMKTILGEQVNELAEGGERMAFNTLGSYLMNNDMNLTTAGLPMPEAISNETRLQARASNIEEFKNQNLAYRLFDRDDPRSFFAQILDEQSPDPADNLARQATSLLGAASRFGDILMKPIVGRVNAAELNQLYDYGRPITGFVPQLLHSDNESMENLFRNADEVADILEVNSQQDGIDNYVERAKKCFGREIISSDMTDEDGIAYKQWALAPPVPGGVPLNKDVINPDNKCYEGQDEDGNVDVNNPWIKTRIYIYSSTVMDSIACFKGSARNTESQQACAAIGNSANSGAE